MAQHKVKLKVPDIEVGNVDVVFEVRKGNALFGRVQISKGGIDWTPNRGKRRKSSWLEFHEWMMTDEWTEA